MSHLAGLFNPSEKFSVSSINHSEKTNKNLAQKLSSKTIVIKITYATNMSLRQTLLGSYYMLFCCDPKTINIYFTLKYTLYYSYFM